jgi:Restriction Enzyme Adenine Methylase Associated
MKPEKPRPSSVRDLIDHGLIRAPAVARGEHGRTIIKATIEADGSFLWKKERFNSPSVAAGHAITAATGAQTSGRHYFSVNGWKFWHVQCQDELFRSLTDLRNSLPDRS